MDSEVEVRIRQMQILTSFIKSLHFFRHLSCCSVDAVQPTLYSKHVCTPLCSPDNLVQVIDASRLCHTTY